MNIPRIGWVLLPAMLFGRTGYFPALYRYQPDALFWQPAVELLPATPPDWQFTASRLWGSAWLGTLETHTFSYPLTFSWFASDPQSRRDAWDRDLGTFQPLFVSLNTRWVHPVRLAHRTVHAGIQPLVLIEQLDRVRALALGIGVFAVSHVNQDLWAQIRVQPLALEVYSTDPVRVTPPLRVEIGMAYTRPGLDVRAGWEGGTEQQGAWTFGIYRWVHPRLGVGLSYSSRGRIWKTGASSDLTSGLGVLLTLRTSRWRVQYAWRSSGLLGDQHFLGLSLLHAAH